jgi:hypothetical protein
MMMKISTLKILGFHLSQMHFCYKFEPIVNHLADKQQLLGAGFAFLYFQCKPNCSTTLCHLRVLLLCLYCRILPFIVSVYIYIHIGRTSNHLISIADYRDHQRLFNYNKVVLQLGLHWKYKKAKPAPNNCCLSARWFTIGSNL